MRKGKKIVCLLSGDIQNFLPSDTCASLKHSMVAARFPSCQPGGEFVERRVRYLAVKDPSGRKRKEREDEGSCTRVKVERFV